LHCLYSGGGGLNIKDTVKGVMPMSFLVLGKHCTWIFCHSCVKTNTM